MTTDTPLGATRAGFFAAASALPMLRGPAVAFSPDVDAGLEGVGGGEGGYDDQDDQNGLEGGDAQNPGDDPAAEAGEGEGEQPKPKKTAQDRIGELTRARRDAERRAERAERELADARQGKQPPAEETPEDKEPDPADFKYGETDPEFIRALARYEAKASFAAEEKDRAKRATIAQLESAWEDRQTAFANDNPDYFDKIDAEDLAVSPPMAGAIKSMEDGPAVAYHLAQNPDEARRIAALAPLAQVREIGRIQGRLEAQREAAAQNDPDTPKPVSKAPPPPNKNRGQGGRFQVSADTDDFAAFEKAYP